MKDYKIHPAANLFPMMSDAEINELAKDIKQNGLLVPVQLYENQVIDGRNRLKACGIAGVQPEYNDADISDPYMWVWSLNGERRHLNSQEQKVLIWKHCERNSKELEKVKKKIKKEGYDLRSKRRKDSGSASHSGTISTTIEKKHKSREQTAQAAGVNKGAVAKAESLQSKAPELAEKVMRGEMPFNQAMKKARAEEIDGERKKIAKKAKAVKVGDRFRIACCEIEDYDPPKKVDSIITDPPYPKEYLKLYGVLAERAKHWLKDGGILVAMAGQSYLNEIYAMMSEHLDYYWTAAYMTPGQPTPLRQVNINTTWKPLLIFKKPGDKYKGRIVGDVCTSEGNDKDFHKWGQSVSGMTEIIKRWSISGHTILDPFCGAGTTGVAALKHGCIFYGCDILQENADISTARCAEVCNDC